MRNINEIKEGIKSKNQDDWITFDEIDWLIKQAEKVERLEKALEKKDEILFLKNKNNNEHKQ